MMMKKPSVKTVGYWSNPRQPETNIYPTPIPQDKHWKGQKLFCDALMKIQNDPKTRRESYKGSAICRICQKQNGSSEFSTSNWRWPEGFLHYIKDHNIKPEQEFTDWVMKDIGIKEKILSMF